MNGDYGLNEGGGTMSARARLYLVFLTVLVFLSLGLNLIFLISFIRLGQVLATGGQMAAQSLDMAAEQLDDLATSTISMTVPISHQLEVNATVPFHERLEVPINTTIPLNAQLRLTFSLGPAGAQAIDVPIRANIPLSLTIPVEINREIPVHAVVPISMTVPVEVPLAQTPLADQLTTWQRVLTSMNSSLSSALGADAAEGFQLLPGLDFLNQFLAGEEKEQ